MALSLIVGNKNYSSWSMRPWIAMKAAGIPFTEEVISLNAPDFKARVSQGVGHRQGAGAVRRRRPCLGVARDPRIPGREISRRRPVAVRSGGARPRPGDRLGDARRLRAAAPPPADEHVAPGHAGASCRTTSPPMSGASSIFGQIVARASGNGGPFLFGRFGAADAMYAPVVSRFHTYAVDVGPVARGLYEGHDGPAGLGRMARCGASRSRGYCRRTRSTGRPYCASNA